MSLNNTLTVDAVIAISSENPIALNDLAHACGADVEWVIQLVELGIVESRSAAVQPHTWYFFSADLHSALAARRLERDLGVGLEVAALILDLQTEVRRLKAALLVLQL